MTIDELHNEYINLINDYCDCCEKNNLQYYAVGGTLLGTIRHGGFIPWDDDVDFAMPRPDYELFLQKYAGNNILQHYKKNKSFILPYIKLFSKKNLVVSVNDDELNIKEQVYCAIDIYPIDGLGTNKDKSIHRFKRVNLLKHVVYLNTTEGLSSNIFKNIALHIIRCMPSSLLIASLDKSMKRYQYRDSKYVTRWRLPNNANFIYCKEEFGDGIKKEFEGILINVPANYEHILASVYGKDYLIPFRENQGARHSTEASEQAKKIKKIMHVDNKKE